MTTYFWPVYVILVAAGMLGIACVTPYSLELNRDAMDKALERLHRPLWVLVLLSSVQSVVLVGLATALGLLIAPRIRLGVPLLTGLLAGQDVTGPLRALLAPSLLLGIGSASLMLLLEITVFWPRLPQVMRETVPIPALWKRLLASVYGGVDEEILLRLFLLSLLAWLLGLVWHGPNGLPTVGAFWLATVLAAVVFGLGHLPATAALVTLTPLLIGRAILLNGVIGIATGYLYWRYGLASAMLAHFSADLVLHGIGDSIAVAVRARITAGHESRATR